MGESSKSTRRRPKWLEMLDDILIGNRGGFIILNRAVRTPPQSSLSSLSVNFSPIVAFAVGTLLTPEIVAAAREGEKPIAFELISAELSDFRPLPSSSFVISEVLTIIMVIIVMMMVMITITCRAMVMMVGGTM